MATRAAEMRRGERFLNQALTEVMPGRTVEAIKGQRRSKRYKEILSSALPGASISLTAGPRARRLRPQTYQTDAGRTPLARGGRNQHRLATWYSRKGSPIPIWTRKTLRSSPLMRHSGVQASPADGSWTFHCFILIFISFYKRLGIEETKYAC